jgi:hypothetical protein
MPFRTRAVPISTTFATRPRQQLSTLTQVSCYRYMPSVEHSFGLHSEELECLYEVALRPKGDPLFCTRYLSQQGGAAARSPRGLKGSALGEDLFGLALAR